MMKRVTTMLVTVLLASACGTTPGNDAGTGGGSGGGNSTGGGSETGGGSGGGSGGGTQTDGGTGGGTGGGIVTGECGEPANVTRRQAILASQPTVESKKKTVLTETVTFASEAGDPSVQCEVDLRFRDSNGNGSLDVYEDWRKTPTERATDLLGKMNAAQKLGLMAHGTTTDGTTATPSAATLAMLAAELRFAQVTNNLTTTPLVRAQWSNAIQEKAEESALGIPVVLSSVPAHSAGNGRIKARGYSQWPNEAGLAASNDAALIENFGKVVSAEYRAVGIRMALSPSADLATDPRWNNAQYTFGEDSAKVGDFVAAYIKGLQGAALGQSSVAAVVSGFPGAGAAKDGLDARLAKGKFTSYPGNAIDAHIAPFQKAVTQKVAGVMTGYAIAQTGAWTGQTGTLDGTTIEQVGASFNTTLVTGVLRTKLAFSGLVVAPVGAVNDAAVAPLGAPWGVESLTKAARIAKAVGAGVDQFAGVDDTVALTAAKTANSITDEQVNASAGRALAVIFSLGLFEDPFVDAAAAPMLVNTDANYRAGLDAMNRGMVLLLNTTKPAGFLNGNGDGTQMSDKGNAGNGTGKVLPAPPGEPYVAAGCRYFILGDFDLDYIRSVSAGYGELTNDATRINGTDVTTDAQKMALSDYVFIRIAAPFTADADSGTLRIPTPLLSYATQANADALAPIQTARAAIAAVPTSNARIVVSIDSGRLPVLDEVLAFNPSAIYVQWNGTNSTNLSADKIFLDVAFGIANGVAVLPFGVPLSDAAMTTQNPDTAGDGQHPTFIKGFGLTTPRFE